MVHLANEKRQRAIVKVSADEPFVVEIVNSFRLSHCRLCGAFALAFVFLLGVTACNRGRHRVLEVNYVSAVQATLRDQVATIYNRGRHGEERRGAWKCWSMRSAFRVCARRAAWKAGSKQRYLVDQATYDGLQKAD